MEIMSGNKAILNNRKMAAPFIYSSMCVMENPTKLMEMIIFRLSLKPY